MTLPQVPVYKIANFFQVRTPLFPIEAYMALTRGEPALTSTDPLVQRAIAVGSISLFDELIRATTPKDIKKSAHKFLRYQIRMATRPTPYGLFAGVALGRWGPCTDLALQSVATQLHVRPDMEWVLAIIRELEAVPEVRRILTYSANTAMLFRNGRIYVLHPIDKKEGDELTKIPSIRASRPVVLALTLARQPITYTQLHAKLLEQIEGATEEQISGLLDILWQHGILLTNLRPAMTCVDDPAYTLYKQIASIKPLASIAEELHEILETIQCWENAPHEGAAQDYCNLTTRMHVFRREIEKWARSRHENHVNKTSTSSDETRSVLQVDTSHELSGVSINNIVADEVNRLVNLLMRIAPPTDSVFSGDFKLKFIERYGMNRDVPLLEALSVHFGVGDPFSTSEQVPTIGQKKRDLILLEIASNALQQRQTVIEIDDALIARLESPSDMPKEYVSSLDLDLFISASSPEAVDRGDFQLVIGPNFGASQAGRHIGRFANLLGNEMQLCLNELIQREEQSDPHAIWAEMVYTPYSSHAVNTVLRPPLRQYEIVFGTSPGVPSDHVIPIDELTIKLENDHFALYWAKHNTNVHVTVGHMLNAMGAPSLVHFLEVLPFDGLTPAVSFMWGNAEIFPFLPRVQSGKSILSLARWKITTATRENDLTPTTPAIFKNALKIWCKKWQVPRYVYLTFNDNRLLLDLEVVEQQEILRQELIHLADEQNIRLTEAIPGPGDGWVLGPEGTYILEINVPLIKHTPVTSAVNSSPKQHLSTSILPMQRLATPSSDWLFMKLYLSSDFQNDLLMEQVQAVMQNALLTGYIDDWFFIRYADPEPHLRLRFHGEPEKLTNLLMPFMCQWGTWLMHEGPCTRFTFDIYDREIERYGGLEAMVLCERMFGIDSRLVLDFLKTTTMQTSINPLIIGALGVDAIVSACMENPQERFDYYSKRATNRKAIGPLYRLHRQSLFAALFEPSVWATTLPEDDQLLKKIDTAHNAMCKLAYALQQLDAKGEMSISYETLIGSLIHMHCNRFFGINRQAEEQVIGLLLRTYESGKARQIKPV